MGITKNPANLASGIVLILVGLGQAFHVVQINELWTLIVAGAILILEAIGW
jgi:hypothetical protein